MIDRNPYGYVRLSREEMKEGGEPVESKLALRVQILKRLAARKNIELRDENIFIEQGSGTTIDKRPEFLRLMALIKEGRVSHLIATAIDRLIRPDQRDHLRFEEAMICGKVILVTDGTQDMDFGDRDFDVNHGLAFEFSSLMARHEVNRYKKRLRDTNQQRTIEGRRSGGYAVYGYRWVPATWQGKTEVETGRYEVIEEEYVIVKEIFRRIKNEGMHTIVRDFNERLRETGFPAPSGLSRAGKGSAWRTSGLRQIIMNPFYAGYPAHRYEVQKYGAARRVLPREEWGMPEFQQEYEHPVTLEEWEDLKQRIQERGTVFNHRKQAAEEVLLASAALAPDSKPPKHPASLDTLAHSNRDTILTGRIQCIAGYKMQGSGRAYECKCHVEREPHQQRSIRKHRAEAAVLGVLQQALAALPDDLLGRSKKTDTAAEIARRKNQVSAALQKEQKVCSDLILTPAYLRERFGAKYDAEVDRNLSSIKRLDAELATLSKQMQFQTPDSAMTVVAGIRQVGFEAFWDAATMPERREIIGLLFERIIVLPPPAGKHEGRGLDVVMQTWVRQFYTPPKTVALPTRCEETRAKFGLEVKPLKNRGRKLRP